MARRKLEQKNIRSLTKTSSGKSYTITLPIEYVRELKWKERQRIVVKRIKGGMAIKDFRNK